MPGNPLLLFPFLNIQGFLPDPHHSPADDYQDQTYSLISIKKPKQKNTPKTLHEGLAVTAIATLLIFCSKR